MKIERKGKLKKTDIKNCTSYYFDDTMEVENINFDNILLDKNLYKNILVNDVLYILLFYYYWNLFYYLFLE